MKDEQARRGNRPRRATMGTLLLVVGALVILTPLAVWSYGELQWQWELRQYAAAPTPLLLSPAGQAISEAPPAPTTNPVESGPFQPTASGELPYLKFDRSLGMPAYQIEIPRIGVKYLVGEGIENGTLARGPGHYPQTALPGETGNAALAAHRTVRGKPAFFYDLDKLEPGDSIQISYRDLTLTFRVERVFLTSPYDLTVIAPTPFPALTLTTCDPPNGDERRLIVTARLVRADASLQ